jgi:hypothetical protein
MKKERSMNSFGRGLILLNTPYTPMLRRGLDRIRAHSRGPVDILHDRSTADPLGQESAWVLDLRALPPAPEALDRAGQLAADSWAVEIIGDRPAIVTLRVGSDRARLFALYHVAECLVAGEPPSAWAIERRPRVPKRYAWPSAGNVCSPVFRPDQFARSLDELPGLGINGVLITFTPTHGTHYGRETIPFVLSSDGVSVDRQKLPAFRALMDELKSYGLDVHLFHQAFTPASFARESVRAYYNGTRELPGFEGAVERSSQELAEAIFTHLPEVDGLLHHSIECEWVWGEAVSIFPCQDDRAAASAFEAYLRGMTRACGIHGKELSYWTHVSGVSARQIRLQHRVLAEFPEVTVVEDHAWPNNVWPFAPVMGHVADDLQAQVVKGRFGLSIDTTDGEYYGAGALPTAYPDPHIRCAQAAAELCAEMSFVRMNEQSLTPLGTLDDINAIHVIATAAQWWENPCPTEAMWQQWGSRRFGPEAGPTVVSAVKKSREFVTKGVSAGHTPLIDHSGLSTGGWRPHNPTGPWALFANPGKLLVEKSYDELVGDEFRPWQVGVRGVAIDDFLHDSREAEAAMRDALTEIDGVRAHLKAEDAEYLTTCFSDALLMIEAVRYTAIAARANSVHIEDGSRTSRRALEDACVAMEAYAVRIEAERGPGFRAVHWFMKTRLDGEEVAGYGVPIGLRAIAEMYRIQGEA